MNLSAIVRHYVRHSYPTHERELSWFRHQASLEETLKVAGRAENCHSKRYQHQRRITRIAIALATETLMELHDRLQQSPSFHELWLLLRAHLKPIRGIGELYIYDTAVRIGAYLNRVPERVYLHAGTRVGARRFGLLPPREAQRNWLKREELPSILRTLPPSHVENLLCIYKHRWTGICKTGARITNHG